MAIIITVIRGASSDMTATSNSTWYEATVSAVYLETPMVKTFTFDVPFPVRHLPGQHYEIRLTAEGGYQAARLYSAASVPGAMGLAATQLQLTIALLANGEVSPYMHNFVKPGDTLEIRGPLGKFFVWEPANQTPVLLIGGGSGVVPMRAILNEHARSGSTAHMKLVYSAQSADDIIYKRELLGSPDTTITLTRSQPDDWNGQSGRINAAMLTTVLSTYQAAPHCYICGATPFVEAMATILQDLGVLAELIKAERYGA